MGAFLLAVLCAACGMTAPDTMEEANAIQQATASGVDLTLIDSSVRPQDDFFQYANGAWLKSAEMPPDKNSIGTWQDLNTRIQAELRAIVEEMANDASRRGTLEQKVGDFYASYMDAQGIEALGISPLTDELAHLDAIASREDIVRQFVRFVRIGVPAPVTFSVLSDPKNEERHVFTLAQSGLGLPDRDYYLGDNGANREIRETIYPNYIQRLFEAAGVDEAAEKAQAITALEGRLAEAQWGRADSRDPTKRYNRYPIDRLHEALPGLAWGALLEEAGVVQQPYVIIRQPDYFLALSVMLVELPVKTWRAYLAFKLIDSRAPFLSRVFADAHFDFHRRVLQGRGEPAPRWNRGVDLLNEMVGDGLSQIWVWRYFPPEIKARIEDYIKIFVRAFHEKIEELDWMSEVTKAQAHEKLDKLSIKVGYPANWPDYQSLSVKRGDLVGNIARAKSFAADEELKNLHKRPDEVEYWAFPPQTVVAYAVPSRNEIYFLAGNLLAPYFMPDADPAANFGALSMLIGHEMSHLFDDSGRQYDSDGHLNDWWTEEDAALFKQRADMLVVQFDRYEPLEGVHIDGRQTLGENIADLSGASVAYRAYKIALAGNDAPVIDGFTGDQRFFLVRAQIFRNKLTDQRMRQWLETRPHSPARYRVNGIHANLAEFHKAFDVKPGDGMYLPPEQRIEIW